MTGRQRRAGALLLRVVAPLRRSGRPPADLPDGWLPLEDRPSYDPPTPAVTPVERSALWVRLLAGAAAGAVVLAMAVPAAQAQAAIPLTIESATASATAATLPVCGAGQTGTTVSGAGTPAPLGNLQGLPDDVAGGGVFAGVALDGEQVKMAATVIAVGKQMGITKRGVEIGVAVATQQSSLRPEAVNKEWLGLFQQNPVQYTQYRRTDPGGAAWMFFDQLIKLVPQYDTDPRSNEDIGETVQKTTTGWRFAEYNAMAAALADQLMDKVSIQQDDVTCAPAPAEQASTGSTWDPGNIISDAVFYNSSSMTAGQIRTFLLSEGEGCTADACLKNLRLSTPDEPADQYCQAYQGGTNEDAATIIAKFSAACGINPQVMLVTLQKESGLLSRTDTTAANYNAAWGWHCPDSGPGGSANCDPAYAGFFNQGYGMAKQWARYRVDPGKYNYHAGQTVDILWNVVETGCGSAPVTIKNQATASLYNYTPYQPNAASLAAYPGVGDACSSYGNRNFFFLFRKYFGSTGGGSSTTAVNAAVRATGTTVKVPNNQYVSAALAGQTITAPTPQVAAGLAAGFSALGLPYVWGGGGSGAGPNNGCARGGGDYNSCGTEIGFDCSGLTAYVLGMAGYQTPGDSGSQRSGGVSVSWDQALPGDIVGFPGHVAMYLGTFGGVPYILEASWVGTPIHIVPLTRTDMDDRVHRYWTGAAVRSPGVADFSSIVQTYTYTPPSYTSFGDAVTAGSSTPTGYTPNIPRIRPVPYPDPAPVVTIPVDPTTDPTTDPTMTSTTSSTTSSSAASTTSSPTSSTTSSTTSPSTVPSTGAGATRTTTAPTTTTAPRTTSTTGPSTTVPKTTVPKTTVPKTTTPKTAVPKTTTPKTTAPTTTTAPRTTSTTGSAGATTTPTTTMTATATPSTTGPTTAAPPTTAITSAPPTTATTPTPETVAAPTTEIASNAEEAQTTTDVETTDDGSTLGLATDDVTDTGALGAEQTLYLYYDASGDPLYTTNPTSPSGDPGDPYTPISCDNLSAYLTAKNGVATASDGTPLPDCDVPDES